MSKNMVTIQEELARKYVGKQYVKVGANANEVLLYDLASSLVGKLPTATYQALKSADRVLNESKESPASLEISASRLEKVIKGDYNKYGAVYIFHRYVDDTNTTVAYLVLLLTSKTVALKRFSAKKVLSVAEEGVALLNAKVTSIKGTKTIQGINGELLVEKAEAVQKVEKKQKELSNVTGAEPVKQPVREPIKAPKQAVDEDKHNKYLIKLLEGWYTNLLTAGHINYKTNSMRFNTGRGSRRKDFHIFLKEVIQKYVPQYASMYSILLKEAEKAQKDTLNKHANNRDILKLIRGTELILWDLILTLPDGFHRFKDLGKMGQKRCRNARKSISRSTIHMHNNPNFESVENRMLYDYITTSEFTEIMSKLPTQYQKPLVEIYKTIADYRHWLIQYGIGSYKGKTSRDREISLDMVEYLTKFKVPQDSYTVMKKQEHGIFEEGTPPPVERREKPQVQLKELCPELYESPTPFLTLDWNSAKTYSYFGLAKSNEHSEVQTFSPFYGDIRLKSLGGVLPTAQLQAIFGRMVKENNQYLLGALLLQEYIVTKMQKAKQMATQPDNVLTLENVAEKGRVVNKEEVGRNVRKRRNSEKRPTAFNPQKPASVYRALLFLSLIDEEFAMQVLITAGGTLLTAYDNRYEQDVITLQELVRNKAFDEKELDILLKSGGKVGYESATDEFIMLADSYSPRTELLVFNGTYNQPSLSRVSRSFAETFNKAFVDIEEVHFVQKNPKAYQTQGYEYNFFTTITYPREKGHLSGAPLIRA